MTSDELRREGNRISYELQRLDEQGKTHSAKYRKLRAKGHSVQLQYRQARISEAFQ